MSEAGRRPLAKLGVGTAGLVGLSGTAGAHGTGGPGEDPVAFAVVVGLPIVAGLLGGAIAVHRFREVRTDLAGRRVGVVLGVALTVLGVTFATSAVASSRRLGLAGVGVGVLVARSTSRGHGTTHRARHADLALGAVSVHRFVEGVAVGALYGAGAAVGLLGATLLAGHTVLETAAVGVANATGRAGTRAVAAVLVVQLGYGGGAVVGLGLADALPVPVRTVALAVAGGALLVVGVAEAGRSLATGDRHHPVRP
jgi:zinc transporter ZupT